MIRLTRAVGGTVATIDGRRTGPLVVAPWSVVASFADRHFVVRDNWNRASTTPDATQSPAALPLRRDVLDDDYRDAKLFYVAYGVTTTLGAAFVLVPDAPLVTILVLTQVLNAVLLLPLLVFMFGIARDRDLMGEYTSTRRASTVQAVVIAVVALCVIALIVLSL